MRRLAILISLSALSACQHDGTDASVEPTSVYAGQEARDIKALSVEEVRDYLDGAGLGYAKAAELNGYPGPLHVLELADSLHLTAEQRRQVEETFRAMRSEARALGREFVAAEAALDIAFEEGRAEPDVIRSLAEESARIESQIRMVHLEAHLDMMAVLTTEQVATYNRLRGYGNEEPNGHQMHAH